MKKDTTSYCWIMLKTKRGAVRVEFGDRGEVSDVRAHDPSKWDNETWKRERPRLIQRARVLCAKVGTIRTAPPHTRHSEKLNNKVVVCCDMEANMAAGVYEDHDLHWFTLRPEIHSAPVTKQWHLKTAWIIKAVY